MKLRLASLLRCPISGGALALEVFESTQHPLSVEDAAECLARGVERETVETVVKTGVLRCAENRTWYPIVNYVPVMLDFDAPVFAWFAREYADRLADQPDYHSPRGTPRPGEVLTQRNFSAQWNLLGDDELTFTYTHKDREDFIRIELDWPEGICGQPNTRLLNVGCGYGLEAQFLRKVTRSEVFGTELNLSLLNSGPLFAAQPFVHVVIASLFALPYPQCSFQLVYSHGVLHHTYSTEKAFEAIHGFLAPGGMIYIWVYAQGDRDVSMRVRLGYLFELWARPKIAALPSSLQSAVVYLYALRHYRVYRRHGHNRDKWKFKNSLHSMRDRWTPRYAHRHSFHEVFCWFRRHGLACRVVDSWAYLQRFGFPLIGIGLRGVREDRGQLLILTHDQVEYLDRRIINEARVFTERGWIVHLVLTAEKDPRARDLEPGIYLDPVRSSEIEPVADPLWGPMSPEPGPKQYLAWIKSCVPGGRGSPLYAILRQCYRAARVPWRAARAAVRAVATAPTAIQTSDAAPPPPVDWYPLFVTTSFVKKAEYVAADAIMACDLPSLPAALELANRRRVPLIYDSHELYVEQAVFTPRQRRVMEVHEKRGLERANLTFTVAERIKDELICKYQPPRPPRVLYNATVFNRLHAKARLDIRAYLSLPKGARYLLYHGGITPGRNLKRLFEQFVAGAPAGMHLVMLGYGDYFDRFERLAATSRGAVIVHPAVPQEDLVDWVGQALGCVIPYLTAEKAYEFAMPNKLFDCIELGVPFIANQSLLSIRDLANRYPIGYLGPMDTDDGMRQTLIAGLCFIETRPDLSGTFAEARACYGWQAQKDNLCRWCAEIGLPGF
jgi:SAM-dependent methyltransferase/uncharacterized protein YbaR (Trm112 family)